MNTMATISNVATANSASASPSTKVATHQMPQHHQNVQHQVQTQVLVRLDNSKTHVLNFPPTYRFGVTNDDILTRLSKTTHIPKYMLRLQTRSITQDQQKQQQWFASAYTFRPILGGKGGFGTLLKGQSKQAGAKQTLDFGACRDLHGRRLRHVNDELKLRRWREAVQRRDKDGGIIDVEKEMEELRTASGVRNWHLMVPSWGAGEISGKSRYREERKMRREVEAMAREQKMARERVEGRKRERDKVMVDYAAIGRERALAEERKLGQSILEGLKKRRKRNFNDGHGYEDDDFGKKRDQDYDHYDDDGDERLFSSPMPTNASYLCTLSGDIVVGEDEINETQSSSAAAPEKTGMRSTMIQSKSEFGTAAILLDPEKQLQAPKPHGLYYEITIETGGIAQIGWGFINILTSKTVGGSGAVEVLPSTGKDTFLPNSDTGDGVGDDAFSYGFDGCRQKIFHNGKELPYGREKNAQSSWKKGDVIGCLYNFSDGSISFAVNGIDFGVAFENVIGGSSSNGSTKDGNTKRLLFPVLSLNEDEIIGMNIGPSFHHCPANFVGVSDLINKTRRSDDQQHQHQTPSSAGDESGKGKTQILESPPPPRTSSLKEEGSLYTTSMIGGIVLPPPPTASQSTISTSSSKNNDKEDNPKDDKTRKGGEEPIDLDSFTSALHMEFLGMERLKAELFRLGLKCGGSLTERANRLFSIKGVARDQIPKKLRGKNFKL